MWYILLRSKVTPEALLAYVLAAGSSIFPVRWQRAAQRHTLGQADFAVSNVKGPDNGVCTYVCLISW